jgi:tRNA modification GTPase
MTAAPTDTIYALSSGVPPAGIAVVRLSGPDALGTARYLVVDLPEAGRSALRVLRRRDGSVIDQALVLTFQAPRSFTGEDSVEFHLHGSRAIVAALFQELSSFPNLRMAEAGEYARRAFDNGKIDLVEVEGLADLIVAETEMQRRLAIEQASGGLSQRYMEWAERLTRARALIEAELDFADEEDVPGSVAERVWSDVRALHQELNSHLRAAEGGEIIRDGFKVVISGPPNAGKSSLMNVLAKRDVAIVTDVAGTTRDILHVDLDLDGYLIRLYDTAGLRESADPVEVEGIKRAQAAAANADLVLLLEEIDSPAERDWATPDSLPHLRIGTKKDLHRNADINSYDLALSAATGEGLDELRLLLLETVQQKWSGSLVPNRARHLTHLNEASHCIDEAVHGTQLDLRAESLRAAASALGRITGRVDVEQLLDIIFSQFCIGK